MRICHVVYSYYPFDSRVRKEVEALSEAGHEVDVIAVQDHGERRQECVRGIRVHRIPMTVRRGSRTRYLYQYMLFLLASSAVLLYLHLKGRFGVIHIHSLPDFQVYCTLPERLGGTFVVLDLHEIMPEIVAARFQLQASSGLVTAARFLEWMSCAYADRVVTTTEQRRKLLAERGVDPTKLVIVMNSPDSVASTVASADVFRAELGLNGRWVLVQAGGMNQERDLATLVRAAGELNDTHPTSLLLFGRGDLNYIGKLRRIAAGEVPRLDFRIGDWISPDAVMGYIGICEVGVATYERNPLTELAAPHKVMEYVAARKPLVLANLEGLRSTWKNAALFYEPGDAGDLASKIRRILEDPILAESLRDNAQRIYPLLEWSRSRERLLQMYGDFAQRTAVPA